MIYAKQGFYPVLPKYGKINRINCKIWHTHQEMFCTRCETDEQSIVQNVKHSRIDPDQLSLRVMMIQRVTFMFAKKKLMCTVGNGLRLSMPTNGKK